MFWMNDVVMRRRSIVSDTEPGTCRSVKRSAAGKSSQKTSRQRSPPRMPVSQSCTSATFMVLGRGRRRPGNPTEARAGSAQRAPDALAPVVQELRERALEWDLGPPPRRLLDLGGIAFEHHDVRGAQ